MNRTDRKRQAKLDEKQLADGINPETNDPTLTAAMTRQMLRLIETAKRERNIDPPVKFFHAKVEATLSAVRVQAACGKGCAHCCHTWVSVLAPEALFIAKQMRKSQGQNLFGSVTAAHLRTRDLDLPARTRFPTPCASSTGRIDGAFYGPKAQNIGAIWSLSDGTASALGGVTAGPDPWAY